MKDIYNHNLRPYNTFGIDACCNRFVEFDSEDEIRRLVTDERMDSTPYLIIGGGSNLLLTSDFRGTVYRSAIKGIESDDCGDYVIVRVGSGEVWDDFVSLCVERCWYGVENLSGIPGDVGACAVQNIGAYGVEAKNIIQLVEAVDVNDGQSVTFSNADCRYAYRQSRFKTEWKDRYIITRVTFRLSKTFSPQLDYGNIRALVDAGACTAADVRRAVITIRNEKLPDPRVEGNAGSFFMNPIVDRGMFERLIGEYPSMPHYPVDGGMVKIPAGWLIEQCGWKGKSLGRAGVHSRQALVLVNRGGATGNEIVNLCNVIRNEVKEKFGIEINPEVNIV